MLAYGVLHASKECWLCCIYTPLVWCSIYISEPFQTAEKKFRTAEKKFRTAEKKVPDCGEKVLDCGGEVLDCAVLQGLDTSNHSVDTLRVLPSPSSPYSQCGSPVQKVPDCGEKVLDCGEKVSDCGNTCMQSLTSHHPHQKASLVV